MMTEGQLDYPQVEVAVTLLVRAGKLLAVYNPLWGAFTLSMTKRRHWQDPKIPPAQREESWTDAATRAAAEWLGRTLVRTPDRVLDDRGRFAQSDREGNWKRYHFQVFRLDLGPGEDVRSGAVAEWLTPDDFLDENRRPVSPTARYLVGRLREEGIL